MSHWNDQNTEGFTSDELDVINEAIDVIVEQAPGVDMSNINDLINNAWRPDATSDSLIAAVMGRLA